MPLFTIQYAPMEEDACFQGGCCFQRFMWSNFCLFFPLFPGMPHARAGEAPGAIKQQIINLIENGPVNGALLGALFSRMGVCGGDSVSSFECSGGKQSRMLKDPLLSTCPCRLPPTTPLPTVSKKAKWKVLQKTTKKRYLSVASKALVRFKRAPGMRGSTLPSPLCSNCRSVLYEGPPVPPAAKRPFSSG